MQKKEKSLGIKQRKKGGVREVDPPVVALEKSIKQVIEKPDADAGLMAANSQNDNLPEDSVKLEKENTQKNSYIPAAVKKAKNKKEINKNKKIRKEQEFHDISATLLTQHPVIAPELQVGDLRGNIVKISPVAEEVKPFEAEMDEGNLLGNIKKIMFRQPPVNLVDPNKALSGGKYKPNPNKPLKRNPVFLLRRPKVKILQTSGDDKKIVTMEVPVKEVPIEKAVRYNANPKKGLSFDQVEQRVKDGLSNTVNTKKGKSYTQIILGNLFTYFNFVYIAVAVTLLSFGLWQDVLFLIVAAVNTSIAIYQEIKSKKTLDKLKLLTAPHANVIRNGLSLEVSVGDIVLDDIILLSSGKQICADSKVIDGTFEVNEALLTGESASIVKQPGDSVLAGSFVTGGNGIVRADKIGKYNYIEGLTKQACKYHKPRSELLNSLKLVLKVISVIVPVLAIFSYLNNFAIIEALGVSLNPIRDAVRKTAGTIVGIIPAGPFLLTSFTLALSVIRLSRNNTTVQELYCIEMLARVDVLCLDKTGTITDGTMRVVECVDIRNESKYMLKEIVSSALDALDDNNMTSIALKDYFGVSKTLKKTNVVAFSSTRKFSAVSFENEGTYFIGAPEFVLTVPNIKVENLVKKYADQGLRVLLLAHSSNLVTNGDKLPQTRKAVAIIAIEDHIRPDASKTVAWFKQNGVAVKIISGDNPNTVSEIARKVGVLNADKFVSLEGLSDKEIIAVANNYTVFGRVTPEQKAVLVKAMKSWGRTVAMTGDGVNDILALKESDCAIAMASGSEAARNVSHLILMDNNFSSLPKVVGEGRRVVNNIQSATSLYFMKTVYTLVLSILVLMLGRAYPYNTLQVMLLEMFIVGIPTTFLAMQKNTNIIKGNFLANVFKRALPASITFLVGTCLLYLCDMFFIEIDPNVLETMAAITLTYSALFALYFACKPFNMFRGILFACSAIIVTVAVIVLSGLGLFQGEPIFETMQFNEFILLVAIIELSFPVLLVALKAFNAFKVDS